MRRPVAIFAALLAAGAILAGCGGSGAASTPAPGISGTSTTSTTGAGNGTSTSRAASPPASEATHAPSATHTPHGTSPGDDGGGVDHPAGFWYGTDSWPVTMSATAPYTIPYTGGAYGGYIGMAGNWARWQGCRTGNFLAWSGSNSVQADTNHTRYRRGIGTGGYW